MSSFQNFEPLRILLACECSGKTRNAMRARGHQCWSVDFEPSEDDSPFHIQGDMWDVVLFGGPWDMIIAHPTCTYLTNSAEWCYNDVQTKKLDPNKLYGAARREAREEAIAFVKRIWALDIPMIAIENPIGTLSTRMCKPTQIIQPWMFGDDASKGTCLWLKGLPKLEHTGPIIAPRITADGKKRWANQTDSGQNKLPPSDDRWKERSRTYDGIANAFADQWVPDLTATVTLSTHLEEHRNV